MPNIYNEILKNRYDMTEWLIHFTRNTEWGDAKTNLISIVNSGIIISNWAIRNGYTVTSKPRSARNTPAENISHSTTSKSTILVRGV